jgi:hypothetical protein
MIFIGSSFAIDEVICFGRSSQRGADRRQSAKNSFMLGFRPDATFISAAMGGNPARGPGAIAVTVERLFPVLGERLFRRKTNGRA